MTENHLGRGCRTGRSQATCTASPTAFCPHSRGRAAGHRVAKQVCSMVWCSRGHALCDEGWGGYEVPGATRYSVWEVGGVGVCTRMCVEEGERGGRVSCYMALCYRVWLVHQEALWFLATQKLDSSDLGQSGNWWGQESLKFSNLTMKWMISYTDILPIWMLSDLLNRHSLM